MPSIEINIVLSDKQWTDIFFFGGLNMLSLTEQLMKCRGLKCRFSWLGNELCVMIFKYTSHLVIAMTAFSLSIPNIKQKLFS